MCKQTRRAQFAKSDKLATKIKFDHGMLDKNVGTEEEGIPHEMTEEILKSEYTGRLWLILESELNAKNKVMSERMLAEPALE
jgi:hypothetical protein